MAKLHIGADNGKAPINWSDYIGKNADEVIEEVIHYYKINPWVWFRVWTERTDNIFNEGWMQDMIDKILKKDGSESLIADK
jgi:hypothetical protein